MRPSTLRSAGYVAGGAALRRFRHWRHTFERQGLQGIAQDLGQARATLERTWRFMQSTPTVFLPSHDPQALQRLRHGATVITTAREYQP